MSLANELDILSAEIDNVRYFLSKHIEEHAALKAENLLLKNHIANLELSRPPCCDLVSEENKRLRAALELIASGNTFCSYSINRMSSKCANVARVALEEMKDG